ncbi:MULTISPECIES: hypothetical protein [unclassified Chryseobacterium]|uniref:hypothetical protein n=1 Tax=unclassified Chryseobacterium TaxID=2593645 RepID=UPI000D3AAB77|nr:MULTISPECIES: hypothetical protein [unclassified Chryseobacterium]PTT77291.1 hypothetical protein DBR25_03550 [Chryseobacterium sp. HMWF001]PVV52761.1 hypothetical protein DD829_19770 [Chryseobacterium sp. HMWF035]
MLKKVLVFFGIIDEVYTPVPMQWKERPVVEKLPETSKPLVHKTEEVILETLPKPVPQTVEKTLEKPEKKEKELTRTERKRPVNNHNPIENFSEFTKDFKTYCLEKTSNQHMLKAKNYSIYDKNGVTETFITSEDSFITHNEHKTLRIQSECFVKYIQQEYNPITRLIENAYD